jgi:hypothetical protein
MTNDAKNLISEPWRRVWRKGIAPFLSDKALEALQRALVSDDARLTQGITTVPTHTMVMQNWPVHNACALAFCGWQGEGLETVAEVEEFFARVCYEIDERLGEPAACRWFLNWFDDSPRGEMRTQLLSEVQREQQRRMSDNTRRYDATRDS